MLGLCWDGLVLGLCGMGLCCVSWYGTRMVWYAVVDDVVVDSDSDTYSDTYPDTDKYPETDIDTDTGTN